MQRRPQGEKCIIVPYRGNVEVSESAPKFRIAHLLEVFPENKSIVKAGRRCALDSKMAQKHVGDVVVETRRRGVSHPTTVRFGRRSSSSKF